MELSGRLATFAIADVLQWAQTSRASGSVVFRDVSREVSVTLIDGRIVGAVSTEPSEFFGRQLLARGVIDELQLLLAVRYCRDTGALLGQALASLGSLLAAEVARELAQHVRDVVCGVFLWRHGVFAFNPQARAFHSPEIEIEPIDVMEIVLEGSRWVDELARFRHVLGDDDSCLLPGPAHADAEPDSGLQRRVLAMLQPGMPVARLHRFVGGSYFRFMEAAAGLARAGALEVEWVDPPEAVSEHSEELDRFLDEALESRLEALEVDRGRITATDPADDGPGGSTE